MYCSSTYATHNIRLFYLEIPKADGGPSMLVEGYRLAKAVAIPIQHLLKLQNKPRRNLPFHLGLGKC